MFFILVSIFCATGHLYSSDTESARHVPQGASKLTVVNYTNSYEKGIRDILNQMTPDKTLYSYLVGRADDIIDHLHKQPDTYEGYVLFDGAPNNVVAGFAVCAETHDKRYYDDGEASRWWYVEWLALLEKYQGMQPSGATLLWDKIVKVATEKGLPIMLNTLKTNKRMQQWCERRGMTPEGSQRESSILTFYSYQEHLPTSKRVNLTPYRSAVLSQSTLPSQSSSATASTQASTQQSQSLYTLIRQNLSQLWASPKSYLQSWYSRYKTLLLGGTTILVGGGLAAWLMRNYSKNPALPSQLATKNK